eukprot:6371407-Pyramimonas_sp.AAC.1
MGAQSADWFDSRNEAGKAEREIAAKSCMEDMLKWMEEGGQVGIFDGTNSNAERRSLLADMCHGKCKVRAARATPSKEPVRCTRSLLLGILGVHNVGNTAFWTFVSLVYCTTHLDRLLTKGYHQGSLYAQVKRFLVKHKHIYGAKDVQS